MQIVRLNVGPNRHVRSKRLCDPKALKEGKNRHSHDNSSIDSRSTKAARRKVEIGVCHGPMCVVDRLLLEDHHCYDGAVPVSFFFVHERVTNATMYVLMPDACERGGLCYRKQISDDSGKNQ